MLLEIQPTQTCPLSYNNDGQVVLKDTETYILEDSWTRNIPCSRIPASVKQFDIDTILNDGESILFIRSMGMGDMLFLSPLLSVIKQKYPTCKIGFASVATQHSMLNIIPNIDEVIEYPIKKEIFDKYTYQFTVSGLIEGNTENKTKNIYQVYLEHLGISPDILDETWFRPIVKESLIPNIITEDSRLIGIHPFAVDPIRQLNLYSVGILIDNLLRLDYKVIVFSSQSEKKMYGRLFPPETMWSIDDAPDMRFTAINLAKCSVLFSTDSVMTHLAQAINVRCIALYGPFASESRVGGYKNITVIDNNPDCRCATHQKGECPKRFKITPCLTFDVGTVVDLIDLGEVNMNVTSFEPEINKYNWEDFDGETEIEAIKSTK